MKWSPKLAPLGLMLLMTSCASSPSKSPVQLTPALTLPSSSASPKISEIKDPLCSQVRVVKLSQSDTTETIAAVIANNAAIRGACPGQ